jgi:hypothetical protein
MLGKRGFPIALGLLKLNKLVVLTLLVIGGASFVSGNAAYAAEVTTDTTVYPPGDTTNIFGFTFSPSETVTVQITALDGSPVEGEPGQPWDVLSDGSGDFLTSWIVPVETMGDTLLVTATGQESGETATTSFLCPPTNLDQLHNGTTTSPPKWSNGDINSNNSCYSEGGSVPYRYFINGLNGNTNHYFTIQMEWTKNTIHAFDYLTNFDATEDSAITIVGGPCGTIATSPPPGCTAPTDSLLLPDPTDSNNYSGTIPSDFFTKVNPGFVLDGPRYLKAYNITILSVGPYYFTGTSNNRQWNVKVSFKVETTGSVGFFWGGHLAESSDDAWGAGKGSAYISGGPYHMRAINLDGGGGANQDRSVQTGVVCLPPDATVICASDSVCADTSFTYVCRDTSDANSWTWTVINGTIIGSHTLDSVVFRVNSGVLPGDAVLAIVEACDGNGGCPGDYCCDADTMVLLAGNCNRPPVATCAANDTLFVCDLSQICIPGFSCSDPDNNLASCVVSPGTLSGDTVCFTPVEGTNTITLIATDDEGEADTCQTTIYVVLNSPPVASCPPNDTLFVCDLSQICVEGFACYDPDGNLNSCAASPGTLIGDSVCFTPVAGNNTITLIATDVCGKADTCQTTIYVILNSPPVASCPVPDTLFACSLDTTICVEGFSCDDPDNNFDYSTINGSPFPGGQYCFTPVEGMNPLTLICTDSCGAPDTCETFVYVELNSPPAASCPSNDTLFVCDLSQICVGSFTCDDPDGNLASCLASPGTLIGDSVCFTPVAGNNTITLIATDSCGKADTCQTTIYVALNSPPVATCPDDDTMFVCNLSDICIDGFSCADPDGNVVSSTINGSPFEGGQYCFTPVEGDNILTLICTDTCGVADTCQANIHVTLNSPPIATCPGDDSLFVCDLSDICIDGFSGYDPDGNLQSVAVTGGTLSGDTVCFTPVEGMNIITLIVTDSCGAADTCATQIYITLNTAPVCQFPDDTTVFQCGPQQICRDIAATDDDGNFSHCAVVTGPGSIVGGQWCFTPSSSGQYSAVIRCYDSCNAYCEDTITVTVEQNVSPQLTCPSVIDTFLCAADTICYGVTVVDPDDGLNGTVTPIGSFNPVSKEVCFYADTAGTYQLTLIVWDNCGAADTCVTTVNVDINSPPVATCPDPDTVFVCSLDTIVCVDGFSCDDPDNNFDYSTINGSPFPGGQYCFTPVEGLNPLTLICTDSCGAADTCETFVYVELNSPPVATCAGDDSLFVCSLDQICIEGFSCSDVDGNLVNCVSSVGTLIGDSVCFTPVEGMNTITLIATDSCGEADTCVTQIYVTLNSAPVCDFPDDSTVFQCGPQQICMDVSATDVDGNFSHCAVVSGPGSIVGGQWCFTPSGSGQYSAVIRCYDSCNAYCEDTITVTVEQNVSPQLTCPSVIDTFLCAADTICYGVTVVDPDDGLSGTVTPTGSFNPVSKEVCFYADTAGTYQLTLIVWDNCGAADTCVTTVNVDINSPPVASCPSNDTLFVCDLSQICLGSFTCYDPDGNLASCVASPGTLIGDSVCFTPVAGNNTITLIATDSCGEADTCQTTIYVVLNSAPVASCPLPDTVFVCSLDTTICVAGFSCDDPDNNLDTSTINGIPFPGGQYCFMPAAGMNTLTLICVDSCGAADTCVTQIYVTVNSAPVCQFPGDTTVFQCGPQQVCLFIFADDIDGNFSHCVLLSGPGSINDSLWCFTPPASGQYVGVIRCYDSCNAYCEDTITVTVQQNVPPQLTCPSLIDTFLCAPDTICYGVTVVDPDDGITGVVSPIGSFNPITSEVCFYADTSGTYQLTLIVSDNCGAKDTCVTAVTVDINSPPMATCPGPDSVFVCDPGDTICVGGFGCADLDNNLASSTINGNPFAGGQYCFVPVAGINTLTLICTDSCQSGDTCQTFVYVVFNSPPVAGCPGDKALFLCQLGQVCIPGFSCGDVDGNLVSCVPSLGTLHGDTVCFTPAGEGTYTIILTATDACNFVDACTTEVTVTLNSPPEAICPDDQTYRDCELPQSICVAGFDATDLNGNIQSCVINGTPFVPGEVYCFAPDSGLNTLILTCVDVCGAIAKCTTTVDVQRLPPESCFIECPTVVIENKEKVHQGGHEQVCVWVSGGTEKLGGFDMLIAYDASALILTSVAEGDLYTLCGWEYFTYRFGPFGNCGNQCPSGLVRVVGLAEINNGPFHPSCFKLPTPFTLFCLDFLVTGDQTFECSFVPIQFFWLDCGDNSISSKDGDTLWVSDHVYIKGGGPQSPDTIWGPPPNEEFMYIEITDMFSDFPTYTGVQAECLVDPDGSGPKEPPIPCIDFYGGGIDIICVDSLDDRGDINLNGVPNEIADAVMFTNYFIYGLGVFKINPPGQIAATDINADGLTLSVADLVYLVRIIVGDALPYPKLAPVTANYTNDGGVLSVDAQMGAAYVVVQGNVKPELLAGQMEIKYAYDAEANVTRVLVYSLEGHGFSGEFLNANGNVVSIEMGSYEGAVVKLNNMPADFALHQNYPNPFNPMTTISFNLPAASDYMLTIYNVTGQKVAAFTDRAEAGTVEIEWDASTMASGVYFYRLQAGQFDDTKKMILLK